MSGKTYEVEWTILGLEDSFAPQTTRVKIIEGYTTVDDIPTILAVRRTGRPKDAVFIKTLAMREVTE